MRKLIWNLRTIWNLSAHRPRNLVLISKNRIQFETLEKIQSKVTLTDSEKAWNFDQEISVFVKDTYLQLFQS